jgi:3-oxoacyl-[acyl-carrier protein] reductase
MLLSGQAAIVTGSAVGLGRAIAVALAREGASVAINYSKSKAEADETARAVEQAGGRAIVVQANVAVDADARALAARAAEAFGRLDILVNNAGITRFVPFKDLDGVPDEAWNSLYDVNVKGAFYCARAVAPFMRQQGSGSIVNVASISGLRPGGSSIPYAVSKAAMIHLSTCLAKALAPDIRVNAVAPGFISETRWWGSRPDYAQRREQAGKSNLLGRVAVPAEIAEAVLFFAASAHFVTGTVVTVDGGSVIA